MFKMTPRDALRRQEEHIKHYGSLYSGGEEALRKVVQARTKLEGLDLDTEYDIGSVINKCVPRGGDIEYIVFGRDHGGN